MNKLTWQIWILILIVVGSLVAVFLQDPIPQVLSYHNFADSRTILGIPNFFDVLSNLPFIFVGLIGLRTCGQFDIGPARRAWQVFFVGIGLVSIGSAYYHWAPDNATLVWDRLPMTIGFMGLFVALLIEHLNIDFSWNVLSGAIGLGIISVAYWAMVDDLRLYAWVQFMPLLVIVVLLILFNSSYSHRSYLAYALTFYLLAKLTEHFDPQIFDVSGNLLSGHSIKHILAAIGCYFIVLMLQKRELT